MKYKQKSTAVENLERIFSKNPESDVVTLEQAFEGSGRNMQEEEKNRNWLSNLMTHLKYHNLIVPKYSLATGKRVLTGLQLSIEGKRALGRIPEDKSNKTEEGEEKYLNKGAQDILNLMRTISRLKEENPDYEINFDVRLKGSKDSA